MLAVAAKRADDRVGLDPHPRGMEIIVELARHRPADPGRLFEIVERRALDRARRAEMHQQRALAVRADAGDLVERRGGQALRPLRAVRADRKAVRFVAQALEIEQQRRIRRQASSRARREGGRLRGPRDRDAGPWRRRRPARRGRRRPPCTSHTADSWPLPPSISSRSGHSPLCGRGLPSRAARSAARAPRASSRNRRRAGSPAA